MSTEVLTRDISSGRIHRRLAGKSGKLYTLEQDNLDEAGEFEVISAEDLANAEPGELCERCFPPVGGDVIGSAGGPDFYADTKGAAIPDIPA